MGSMDFTLGRVQGDDNSPFPEHTSYVSIQLDAVKSVEILEDSKATTAARNAVSRVYTGHETPAEIIPGRRLGMTEMRSSPLPVQLLRSGRPKPSPEEFIEEDMCRPAFPNTDHPCRMPLTPTSPFPAGWRHCNHATFEAATVCAPLRYAKHAFPTHLPFDAQAKHNGAIREDNSRRAGSFNDSSEQDKDSITSSFHKRAGQDSIISSFKGRSERATTSIPSVSSRGRSPSMASWDEEDTRKSLWSPVAIMFSNLAAVPTLADPQDLLAEIKFLEQLYQEAKARAAVESARAIEEAHNHNRDDAAFGRGSDPSSVALSHGEAHLQADRSTAPSGVPSLTRNPVRMIAAFFHNHRFGAVPAQHTRTIPATP
ncbi:hypothetical protein HWV62_22421 [Athelia sp. TMB]|nr:hypothetical protein HWV62_22421 [Athelia sp. TMB]